MFFLSNVMGIPNNCLENTFNERKDVVRGVWQRELRFAKFPCFYLPGGGSLRRGKIINTHNVLELTHGPVRFLNKEPNHVSDFKPFSQS
jgi:hypothetical protein